MSNSNRMNPALLADPIDRFDHAQGLQLDLL